MTTAHEPSVIDWLGWPGCAPPQRAESCQPANQTAPWPCHKASEPTKLSTALPFHHPPPPSRCAASRSHLAFSLLSLPFHRQFDRDLSRCHLFVIFLCAREASCSICSTTDPSSPSIHASDPFPATPRALHPEAAFSGYGSEPWSRLRSGGGWPRRSPTLRPYLPSPQHHRPRPSLDHMPFRKTRCVD